MIMFVKPGKRPVGEEGPLLVRHPGTKRLLRAEGEEVPDNQYWFRRLRDGDVEEIQRPAAPEPEPEARETGPASEATEAAAVPADAAKPTDEGDTS
jgi:hypothetical protein